MNDSGGSRSKTALGELRLLLELGQGGMGTVYLAVSQGPGGFSKLKVVKRLRADLGADEQFAKMFLDEARLAARLNHPNIVQTNEVGFDGHHYFLEMEYLEGQSLDALLRRARRTAEVPIAEVVWILAQALAGLQNAHDLADHSGRPLNVVHRDVSPHNVFVTYDGAVKVLDFGIAKAADSSSETRTGVVRGKVTYMAPEQASRGKVDRRTDLYAVGIILWQVLADRRLWDGLEDHEILTRLQRDPLPAPSSVRAGVDPALEAICMRALAPKVDDRFASAAEMQLALEEWLAKHGGGVGSRRVAKLVSDLFAERRAAVKSEIEGMLARLEKDTESFVGIPQLQSTAAFQATRTDSQVPRATEATVVPGGGRESARDTDEDVHRTEDRTRTARAVASDAPSHSRRVAGKRASSLALAAAAVAAVGASWLLIDRRHAVPAAAPAPQAKCTTIAECTRVIGGPAICRPDVGVCAPLTSPDCTLLAEKEDVTNQDTVWFGLLLPAAAKETDDTNRINVNVVDLARRDFMAVGGLHLHDGRAHPVGVILCDDSVDSARAARHLIAAGVPAVIGFGSTNEAIQLGPTFIANRILMVEMRSTNAQITNLTQPASLPRLVWRTTENAVVASSAIAHLVSDVLEPRLRAKGGALGGGSNMRVALVRTATTSGLSFASAFVTNLHFNGGKNVAENTGAYREFVARSGSDLASVAQDVAAFQPHAVVYVNGSAFTKGALPMIEGAWPEHAKHRPFYVAFGTLEGDSFYRFVGKSPERRHRFFGIDLPANTDANLKFVVRYNEVFSPPITPGTAPGVTYDALYALAYAAEATHDLPITGPSLSAGLAKILPPGPAFDVGPTDILAVTQLLNQDKAVDVNGAGTSLNFDVATGEPITPYAVYCMKTNDQGEADDEIESGVRYDPASQRFTGTWRCP